MATATQKQIEANRRNARKSTGPRTPEGRNATRFNAVKHGLRTVAVEVLPNENPEAFERELAVWVRGLDPRTEAEAVLARQAATISWKLDRADRYETAVLSRQVIDAVNACDCEDDDVAALRQAAAVASFDSSVAGERLRRYQFSLMRALRQAVDSVCKLKKQAIAPNEPNLESIAIAPNEPNSTADTLSPNEPNLETSAVGRAVHAFHARPASNNTNEANLVVMTGVGDPRQANEVVSAGSFGGTRRAEKATNEANLESVGIAPNEANSTAHTISPNEANSEAEVISPNEANSTAGGSSCAARPTKHTNEPNLEAEVILPNEANEEADTRPTAVSRRDRWPLETLKRKRRQAMRRDRERRRRA